MNPGIDAGIDSLRFEGVHISFFVNKKTKITFSFLFVVKPTTRAAAVIRCWSDYFITQTVEYL